MASPHVAGTAALMIQANEALTPLQLRAILLNEADEVIVDRVNLTACGIDDFGLGRVDAMKAVLGALQGRVQSGELTSTTSLQDLALPVPPGHEAEVTLTWDRVLFSNGRVSRLELEVYPVPPGVPPGSQVVNLSVLTPKPDDNFRHVRFRSPAGGVHTVRVKWVSLVGTRVPFAYAWRSEVGPFDSAPVPPLPPLLSGQAIYTVSGASGSAYPASGRFDGGTTGDLAANAGGSVYWWKGQAGALLGPSGTGLAGGTGSALHTASLGGGPEADLVTVYANTAYAGLGGAPFASTISSVGQGFDPMLHVLADVVSGGGTPSADLVYLVTSGSPTVSLSEVLVRSGNGSGAFGDPPVTLVSASYFDLQGLVAGDFDGDGDSDLVAVGQNTHPAFPNPSLAGALVMFRNDGGGTFPDPRTAGTISHFPEFEPASGVIPFRETLGTGDFNQDGRLDVAAVSRRKFDPAAEARVVVFLGDGTGRFSRVAAVPAWQEVTPCVAGPCPVELCSGVDLAVLPLEADGFPDLAVLVEQLSASPTRRTRLLTLGALGLPLRRESINPPSQIATPLVLHAGENLLGGVRADLVIGGIPSGSPAVEVRYAP